MELEEFVRSTLTQIISAVNAVDDSDSVVHSVSLGGTRETGSIEFDIAVSADSTKNSKLNGGIRVLEVIQGGVSKDKSTSYSTVSRVKFKILASN